MARCTIFSMCLFCYIICKAHSQSNPCDNSIHKPLNDATLLSSYESSSPISTMIGPPGWYRYTGSSDGSILDSCPSGNQCGTNQQIWMNDTVPSVSEGEKSVKICVRQSSDCCRRANVLKVKNCTNYVVFHYTNFPPSTRLCFVDRNASTTTSTSTTTTTTTTTTTSTTSTPLTTPTKPTKTTTTTTGSSETSTKQSAYIRTTQTTLYDPGPSRVLDNQSRGRKCNNATKVSGDKEDPCRQRKTLMTIGIVITSVLDCILAVAVFYLLKSRNCKVVDDDASSETSPNVDAKMSRAYENVTCSDISSRTRFNRAIL